MRGELLERYAPIGRFILLFMIWGFAAWDYKLFMDLSVRGFATSAIFFAACALVIVGYKARASMLLLGLTMVVHGVLRHHNPSLVFGAVALVASAFPIGAYLSLDKYLSLTMKPTPYAPTGVYKRQALESFAKPLTLIILAFMIGGPIYNQVLHHNTRKFLKWDMFAVHAHDLVQAGFFTVRGGVEAKVNYLDLLGYKGSPEVRRSLSAREALDRRITGRDQLDVVIQRVCAAAPDPAALRLRATIASPRKGWVPIYTGSELICTKSAAGAVA